MADADFSVKAIISAQTSQFEKGMKNAQTSINSVSKSIEGVSKLLKSAFSVVGITASIGAVVNFGKSCVKSATEANKQFKLLNNTIRATGADAWTTTEEMDNLAKSLSDSTNYSVTEIEKMQSVLLGFRDITGKTFEDASNAVLDMATVMGMDLTSAVQTVGKALDDPIKGLDSLRRQGFQFTEQQKAELAQLVKTGKKMEAQKIILDELARSYGGASKAGQDAFAKQRHAVENFSDALGGKLLPLMKSFAIDNANMINSLRDSLDNIDFNQIGAVIKVTFDTVKNAIKNAFEPIKSVGSELKNFISEMNFQPIISIIDNLVGALKRIGEIKFDNSMKAISSLKDIFAGIGESVDLNKFSEVINLVISGFVFLYEEANKVIDTLKDNIKTFVINAWNSIKSIFEASNKALADSETDIKSWSDFFYNIFNSIFKSIQDLIHSVSALLKGDWKVAWEYMKLVVLRILKGIMDAISAFVTAFPKPFQKIIDTINGIVDAINTAIKWLHLPIDELKKIDDLKPVNLSESLGLDKLIADSEKAIEKATGAYSNKNLKDLEKMVSGSKSTLGRFVDNFKEATEQAKKELDGLAGDFNASLGPATTDVADDTEKTFKMISDWDIKLLNQRLENLHDYSKEYHEIQTELIEAERAKAHQADSTGAETLKIDEYYNHEIEKENERSEKAKIKLIKDSVSKMAGYLKSFASTAVAVFKNVVSTIKNVFSSIGNFLKNTFDKVKNSLSTLFEFDIDEALDNLLEIEDAILTFFVETLPKLPAFLDSAFSSVLILVQNIMSSIDWGKVNEFLNSMVKTFVTYAPEIIDGIVSVFTNLVSTISNILVESAPDIVKAFGDMFFSIIEAIPAIFENIIGVLGSYISNIGKYFADNARKLSDDLTTIVKSIVDGIANFIKEGGWRNLLHGLLAIQKAIENAIADNIEEIAQMIEELLPDLVQTLIDSIVSASKTLGKIAKTLLPLIAKIIIAIINVITSDEVVEASIEAIEGIVEGLVPAIVDILVNALPKIINFFLLKLPGYTPKLISGIIKGLIKGFTKVNWLQVVEDIFTSFVDAIKDFFGIHSPSTLFEKFGEFMMQGLWNGMKNLGSWLWDKVSSLFSNIADGIKNCFKNIGDWFKDVFSKAWDGIKNAWGNVVDWFSNVGDGIKNAFNGIGDWFKSTFEKAVSNIKGAFEGIGDWFKGLWDNVKNGWENVKSKVEEGAKTVGETVASAVDGGVTGTTAGDVALGVLTGGVSAFGHALHWWANGTDKAPKGLSIVGEAGPELVRFNGGEQVLNAHNTQKALDGMGGKTINQSITFYNLKDTTAFAMMQQMRQYNRQLAINGII